MTRAGDLALSRNAQNGLLTGTALGSITDAWDYNTFGEPTGYYASYNGASLLAAQYARDALGRVDQKTETIGGSTDAYSYTYDLAGRLSGVQKNGTTVATYTYDGNGNRLTFTDPGGTISGAYDDQDRLLQYGSTTYTYTEGGELSSKTTGGQTTTYHYDALGNLLAVSLPDGTQIEYLIDGANRRVGKKVNGVLVKGFLYEDALRPIAELDGAGNVVSRFGYGTRVNVPDYMVKGGTTYRFILDPLGSPRLVVNVATGQIAQRIDYDGFGSVINDTNPGFQPFGFAGGLYDGHTRLIRFGARDYDSQAGRWTAEDQLRYLEKDTNRYAYLSNDPVNWIDPTGEAQYPGNLPTPPHAPEGYRFRGTIVVENYQLKYSDVPWGEEDKPGAIIQLSAETIVEDFKLKSDRIIAHVFTPIENKDLICDSGYR